ncbi:MAG: ABC transporter ATP-binding protein [Candidatus Ratteibacteria bacterium]
MPMITVENLSKSYHRKQETVLAVQNVSFTLHQGNFLSIKGPSGCGKTTLLLTVAGLLSPDKGNILFEGKDIYTLSSEERALFRARNTGFIFQQFHLIPFLTVEENVLVPTLAVERKKERRDAKKILDQFHLTHRLHHFPSELSTGERQRVALARACINSPKVLFADEPTGNLDEENSIIVLEYLRAFAHNGGAVLMVTHDKNVANYTDKTQQMKNGIFIQK